MLAAERALRIAFDFDFAELCFSGVEIQQPVGQWPANSQHKFERFRRLNVRSNEDLDRLVAQAQQLVQGITPQDLRDNGQLRQQIATDMTQVQTTLEGMLVEMPRRQIIRPSRNGGNHGPAD